MQLLRGGAFIILETKWRRLSLPIYSQEWNRLLYNWGQLLFIYTVYVVDLGRLTHICASKLTIIGLDNGLSPGRRQAIIWINAGVLLIWPLVTKFSEILIEIRTFWFKRMHLNMSSGKWRQFCLGLNVSSVLASNREMVVVKTKMLDQI